MSPSGGRSSSAPKKRSPRRSPPSSPRRARAKPARPLRSAPPSRRLKLAPVTRRDALRIAAVWAAWFGALLVALGIGLAAGAYTWVPGWLEHRGLWPLFAWDFNWYDFIARAGYPEGEPGSPVRVLPLWPPLLHWAGTHWDVVVDRRARLGVEPGRLLRDRGGPAELAPAQRARPRLLARLLRPRDRLPRRPCARGGGLGGRVRVAREAAGGGPARGDRGARAAERRSDRAAALVARPRPGLRGWPGAALPVAAAAGVEAYFWARSDHATAFFDAQRLWGRDGPSELGTWADHVHERRRAPLAADRAPRGVAVVALVSPGGASAPGRPRSPPTCARSRPARCDQEPRGLRRQRPGRARLPLLVAALEARPALPAVGGLLDRRRRACCSSPGRSRASAARACSPSRSSGRSPTARAGSARRRSPCSASPGTSCSSCCRHTSRPDGRTGSGHRRRGVHRLAPRRRAPARGLRRARARQPGRAGARRVAAARRTSTDEVGADRRRCPQRGGRARRARGHRLRRPPRRARRRRPEHVRARRVRRGEHRRHRRPAGGAARPSGAQARRRLHR